MGMANAPVASTPSVCPSCAAPLTPSPGYVVWCERCEWNLQPDKPPTPTSLLASSYARLGEKLGQGLFDELRQATSLRPTITPALVVATLFALFVHLVSIGLIVLGALLI